MSTKAVQAENIAKKTNESAQAVEVPQNVREEAPEQYAREFIFQHESSGRLDNVNKYGCIGLVQDCNGELVKACPDWQTDMVCQLDYWEGYMRRRDGTWAEG